MNNLKTESDYQTKPHTFTCYCRDCTKIKDVCSETFDTIPHELVWLIVRFTCATPIQIPREFISYPFAEIVLYNFFPKNPEQLCEHVLKFLYPAIRPVYPTFKESWTSNKVIYNIMFDGNHMEWCGVLEIPTSMLNMAQIFQLDLIHKPAFVSLCNIQHESNSYPFFGVDLGSNCYHETKHILKKYQNEINKQCIE